MTGNEAVLNVVSELNDCGVQYMLVGSYSTNVYGIPRSTQDADFVIALGDMSIAELSRRLAPSIRIDPQLSLETVTMTRRYVAELVGTPFKIELFLLSGDAHDQERFRQPKACADPQCASVAANARGRDRNKTPVGSFGQPHEGPGRRTRRDRRPERSD